MPLRPHMIPALEQSAHFRPLSLERARIAFAQQVFQIKRQDWHNPRSEVFEKWRRSCPKQRLREPRIMPQTVQRVDALPF
jgi:hypothetical protein